MFVSPPTLSLAPSTLPGRPRRRPRRSRGPGRSPAIPPRFRCAATRLGRHTPPAGIPMRAAPAGVTWRRPLVPTGPPTSPTVPFLSSSGILTRYRGPEHLLHHPQRASHGADRTVASGGRSDARVPHARSQAGTGAPGGSGTRHEIGGAGADAGAAASSANPRKRSSRPPTRRRGEASSSSLSATGGRGLSSDDETEEASAGTPPPV